MRLNHLARLICSRWLGVLCTLLLGPTQARAAWRAEVATEAGSGISIELASPFEHSPPAGCMPLWVTIRNDSGTAHTWEIVCTGNSTAGVNGDRNATSRTVRVENGETLRVLILMALDTSSYGYYYTSGSVHIEGFAVPLDAHTPVPGVYSSGKSTSTHTVGLSEALATPIWTSLTKHFTDDGKDLLGSPVDLTLIGGDWRALAGLDALWLTDADYVALDPSRRETIGDWVNQGGRLVLCAQTVDPSLRAGVGLPETGDEADVGLGHVKLLAWDGKPLPLDEVAAGIEPTPSPRVDPAFTQADWPMVAEVGRIPINAPFLIAFIVLFAIVVGPLNLFWFASAARRHRLFWTTPLLSVGASLLLAGFIIVQDGFGGHGERVLFCLLLPAEKKAVFIQEQVARTGVLFSRQFQIGEDVLLTPLQIGSGNTSHSYEQSGRNYSGDWFASRSVQAQRAEAVVPSRAEIQLLNADAASGGAPPVVTSSVPATIATIQYLDAQGRAWVGENLRTGERITLHEASAGSEIKSPIGGSDLLDEDAKSLLTRRGNFVARAQDGPFFDTLPSIRWTKQTAVFAGPISVPR